MNGARDITRTVPFWLIFAASTLGGITNSASTPLIPVYVTDVLGGGTELAGALISLAAVASMLSMPIAGVLGDRFGYRLVAVIGSAVATAAMVLLVSVPTVWGAGLSRILFGLGGSAAVTLLMAWLVTMAAPGQRGKALSIYGLSVWIGLALGPPLGTAVEAIADPRTVFLMCAGLELLTGLLILALPRVPRALPRAGATPRPRGLRALWRAFLAVWTPGVVAAAAWCGEGLMLGFLIVHLSAAGIPATGITGAASVFAVFAVSVIVARLFLASLPDRIGPLRATAISLVALTAGLTTLALAGDFWMASVGAALIGVGFSPLYPSLTMLATRGLHPENRALGVGLFSSFTSIGYGGGAIIGGAVIATAPSMWAFLLVAGLQLVALAVLVIFTRDDSPRTRTDAIEPRDPAA
ncbi:MFS transporter [Microbacterium proteolyticum]|uniref:MFS transporter n=1 Tax=Microbacterium proteolyticum TaxID=1572644 RepID=UPI002417C374|nr:MFS transporter [Microbacterium proteolyticum]